MARNKQDYRKTYSDLQKTTFSLYKILKSEVTFQMLARAYNKYIEDKELAVQPGEVTAFEMSRIVAGRLKHETALVFAGEYLADQELTRINLMKAVSEKCKIAAAVRA